MAQELVELSGHFVSVLEEMTADNGKALGRLLSRNCGAVRSELIELFLDRPWFQILGQCVKDRLFL